MSTRARALRAVLDRLRDPLWLPLLCALAAYAGWQAAASSGTHRVLVPIRQLRAGTELSPALVQAVRWRGSLPGTPLATPSGRLRVGAAKGLPLLVEQVRKDSSAAGGSRGGTLALPLSQLLSAPQLPPGSPVLVYAAPRGAPPELICSDATVAAGSTSQALLVTVPASSVQALVDGLAAGRLIVVGRAQ